MAQGSTKTFCTDVSLNVKVGNAGGVDLTVNGKKV
ncbi:MAG: RodZ domain-containing protein, partial [Actinomycetes bacterium]